MSESFRPTPAQQACVDTQGGGIIVSAAAGSGKTRVLVQRVIRLLTEDRIPADRLLVLTFTNAAAAEMRSRMTAALDDLIRQEPDNLFYRRQQLLLGSADICTVHSFCSKLVRENFFRFGIRRDFRIDENQDIMEIKQRLMAELIEELYRDPSPGNDEERSLHEGFETLSLALTGPRMDGNLEVSLLSAYEAYKSNAFPDVWLQKASAAYDPALPIEESPHFRFLAEIVSCPLLREMKQQRERIEDLTAFFEERLAQRQLGSYEKALEALGDYALFWDGVQDCVAEDGLTLTAPVNLCRLMECFEKQTVRGGNVRDEGLKEAFRAVNDIGEFLKKVCRSGYIDVDAYEQDNRQLYPAVLCLKHILTVFDRRLMEAKAEKGVLEFHDLENLAMQLLYEKDPDSGAYHPSSIAKELSGQYDQIMVDEYQDTNDIQEQIFKALSRNEENLFMVGDIKQSIYSFRQAEPGLFKARCARSVKVQPDREVLFPARIILDRNFRSRPGIIDGVNYVFGLLMSEESSQIDYNEEEMLSVGASYPPGEGYETEFHLVEYDSTANAEENSEEEDPDKLRTEAAYCAKVIEDMVRSGLLIGKDEKTRHPVRYGDICILLRKVTGMAHIYSGELERLGIPAYTGTEFDLLTQYEVRAAMSYLKVVNNPLSDIDLTASLLCPVFGFTPDDVALLRQYPERTLYGCLLLLTSSPEEPEDPALASLKTRLKAFQETLSEFRLLSVTVPSDRLLSMIFEKTGWLTVMRTMNGGEMRSSNLLRLRQVAADYENNTGGGLSGFIRRLRYLEESGEGIQVSDAAPPDAVRIMTIHSSKGLEFPVCLLAGLDSKTPVNRDKLQTHSRLGVGLQSADPRTLLHCHTLQEKAIAAAKLRSEKWEMLRVLYVAMTRPMEKLLLIRTVKTGEKDRQADSPFAGTLEKTAGKIRIVPGGKGGEGLPCGRMDPYAVQENLQYGELLTMCALVQEGMREMRRDAGIGEGDLPLIPTAFPWKYVPATADARKAETAAEKYRPPEAEAAPDEEIIRQLRELFGQKDFDPTTVVPSKVAASVLAHQGIEPDNLFLQTPEFLEPEEGTAAERGTAAHTLLRYADLSALAEEIRDSGSFEGEKQRILRQHLMSRRQMDMLRDEDILRFIETPLFRRMMNGKKLYREMRFTVEIPGRMAVISGLHREELEKAGGDWGTSLMQGAIDCLIEEEDGMVIVDYKTDRIKRVETLVRRYAVQLKLYRKAVEELFEKPVKACILYSLPLGEETEAPTALV